jgi:hypothetical protein
MKALLKIVEGPNQGTEHWVESGSILGRKKGTILIQDPRVSAQHAQILNENDSLFVLDLKSTHGLWSPEERVNRLKLIKGSFFKIGDTKFQVIRVEQTEEDRAMAQLLEAVKKSQETAKNVSPFPAVLLLEFLQGHHTGEIWPLGYGPRSVGTQSLDLRVFDPDAREECFRLECRNRQVYLVSSHKDFVKVNDQFTQETSLQPNDLISFGETIIKVTALATGA